MANNILDIISQAIGEQLTKIRKYNEGRLPAKSLCKCLIHIMESDWCCSVFQEIEKMAAFTASAGHNY